MWTMMVNHIKMPKQTVMKQIRDTGYWTGYLVPSRCGLNIGNPFSMAMRTTFTKDMLTKETEHAIVTPVEKILNEFKYYNCSDETGNVIHFYKEEEGNFT